MGFGEENARGYVKRLELTYTLDYFPYEAKGQISGLSNPASLLDGHLENLGGALQDLENNLTFVTSWEENNPFFCTQPYCYAAFQSSKKDPEIDLVKQQVIDLYNSENFLEDFLCLLTKS